MSVYVKKKSNTINLFGILDCPGFSNNSNFNLTGISHFILYFTAISKDNPSASLSDTFSAPTITLISLPA